MKLLSKKELLNKTGISYGQLYRWKRQGLIPEEWFIKQAVHTGQETFFPGEQILARVSSILELKDTHSLKEMLAVLSPEFSQTSLSQQELAELGVEKGVLRRMDSTPDTSYTFQEAVYLHMLSKAVEQDALPEYVAAGLARSGLPAMQGLQGENTLVTLFRGGGSYHVVFTPDIRPPVFDNNVDIMAQYSTAAIAETLKGRFHAILAKRNKGE